MAAQFNTVMVDGLVYMQNADSTTVSLSYKSEGWNWHNWNNYSESSITIPESIQVDGKSYIVNAIGDYALNNCHNLTEVYLPRTIKSIGTYAFSCCDKLKELVLPDSLETISSFAFFNCLFDKLTIPSSVKNIYFCAFYSELNQGGAINVYISDLSAWLKIIFGNDPDSNPIRGHLLLNNEAINNLVIPDEIDVINNCALVSVDCDTLTIPDHVTYIGDYAFYRSSAKSIKVGNGVKEIGSHAFAYCSKVSNIELGTMVETIHTPAFNGLGYKTCSLKTFICKATTPPLFVGSNGAFIYYSLDDDYEDLNLDDVKLVVPYNSQKSYRDADGKT